MHSAWKDFRFGVALKSLFLVGAVVGLVKRCEEVVGCIDADFYRETGIVSILVELGLELSADWKEVSKFFLTAVEYVGADLRDEEGIVVAFR